MESALTVGRLFWLTEHSSERIDHLLQPQVPWGRTPQKGGQYSYRHEFQSVRAQCFPSCPGLCLSGASWVPMTRKIFWSTAAVCFQQSSIPWLVRIPSPGPILHPTVSTQHATATPQSGSLLKFHIFSLNVSNISVPGSFSSNLKELHSIKMETPLGFLLRICLK